MLLKEATLLKKQSRYDEACQTLRLAFLSAGANEIILIEERLRLPAYLLLAGRRDDGWAELNLLAGQFHEPYDQVPIRNKMRVFAEKEERWSDALFYSAWVYILKLKNGINFIKSVHHQADIDANEGPLQFTGENGSIYELDFRKINADNTPLAYTENGNPIFDVAHNHMLQSLNRSLSIEVIENEFESLCAKLHRPELPPVIADEILKIIEANDETGEWVSDLHQFFRQQLMG